MTPRFQPVGKAAAAAAAAAPAAAIAVTSRFENMNMIIRVRAYVGAMQDYTPRQRSGPKKEVKKRYLHAEVIRQAS
jgi:hypothetical protein